VRARTVKSRPAVEVVDGLEAAQVARAAISRRALGRADYGGVLMTGMDFRDLRQRAADARALRTRRAAAASAADPRRRNRGRDASRLRAGGLALRSPRRRRGVAPERAERCRPRRDRSTSRVLQGNAGEA
jgi:hypothetical protein